MVGVVSGRGERGERGSKVVLTAARLLVGYLGTHIYVKKKDIYMGGPPYSDAPCLLPLLRWATSCAHR
jgi:hypothetical protein